MNWSSKDIPGALADVDWRLTDIEIAKQTGVSKSSVNRYRHSLGKPLAADRRKAAARVSDRREISDLDWRTAGLGALSDAEVAEQLGTSVLRVRAERRRQRIPEPPAGKNQREMALFVCRLPRGFAFDFKWLARQLMENNAAKVYRERAAFLHLVDVAPSGDGWVRR